MRSFKELADFMRKGAALRPQCFGATFRGGESCALAAMYEGAGYPVTALNSTGTGEIREKFPELSVMCLCLGGDISTLAAAIVTMNDADHYTREQIADWLEALVEGESNIWRSNKCPNPA